MIHSDDDMYQYVEYIKQPDQSMWWLDDDFLMAGWFFDNHVINEDGTETFKYKRLK